MSDRQFYVGARNGDQLTGFVPAKFLMRNGTYVMDPTPGGSQRAFLYPDASERNKTAGSVANPNNYLIVPANYNEQQARDFASQIAEAVGRVYPEMGSTGLFQALAQMAGAFRPGGSQDLQRHPNWGIPEGSVVPAFVGSASNHLGYVTGLAGLPVDWSEIGGGALNAGNALRQSMQGKLPEFAQSWLGRPTRIDTEGRRWLSRQNEANISQGYSDGLAASTPPSPFNDYGYAAQPERAEGQIGDGNGIADWTSSLSGIDPDEPAPPA